VAVCRLPSLHLTKECVPSRLREGMENARKVSDLRSASHKFRKIVDVLLHSCKNSSFAYVKPWQLRSLPARLRSRIRGLKFSRDERVCTSSYSHSVASIRFIAILQQTQHSIFSLHSAPNSNTLSRTSSQYFSSSIACSSQSPPKLRQSCSVYCSRILLSTIISGSTTL